MPASWAHALGLLYPSLVLLISPYPLDICRTEIASSNFGSNVCALLSLILFQLSSPASALAALASPSHHPSLRMSCTPHLIPAACAQSLPPTGLQTNLHLSARNVSSLKFNQSLSPVGLHTIS